MEMQQATVQCSSMVKSCKAHIPSRRHRERKIFPKYFIHASERNERKI